MGSSRSSTKTAASPQFSTANCLITSSDERSSGRADTSSSHTATPRSSPIYGKIMARKCGSDCEGSSPSHCGTSDDANSNSDAIVSASRRFSGRGKGTGFFLHPKLKDCSHQAWSRCGRIVVESIMFSLFRPCAVVELVLKACDVLRQAVS